MIAETALLICFAVILIYLYIQHQWTALSKWGIPHEPPSFRNFGHAALLFGKNTVNYELRCKKKFGDVWGLYVMTRPFLIIHSPEIIRHVMVKDFSAFPNRFRNPWDFGAKDVENGVLVSRVRQWKRMRSALSPTFSNAKLKSMCDIMNKCINNTVLRIKRLAEDRHVDVVDIKDLFSRLSLDVICSTAFSIDVNSQDDSLPEPEIARRARKFFENDFVQRLRIFFKSSFPSIGRYIGEGSRQKHASYLTAICQKFIAAREAGPSLTEKEDCPHPSRSDIMEGMVKCRKTLKEIEQHGKGLSDSEISANAITMLLAGYDTTAVAMTYFAYNLAFHSDIQSKLQADIDEAFDEVNEIDFDTVNLKLSYLDMCIHESLRMYCPVATTMRCAPREVTVNGLRIPKGVNIRIPIAALCRDPDLWEDPLVYNPERMRNMQDIDPVIYQPFGTGPRNCLGFKFALLEIKLAFCTILRKYSFAPTDKTPTPPLILKQMTTTSPVEHVELKIIPRR